MNKAELETKHLSELHALAAEAGLPKYRMLSRGELVAQLSDGASGSASGSRSGGSGRGSQQRERSERSERPERPERERPPRRRRERRPPRERERKAEPADKPEPAAAAEPRTPAPAPPPAAEPASKPRRRRRRFGRRGGKEVTLQGLLLPPQAGRQAVVCAESRAACTALLRAIAADLSGSKGADPVALLIDPSPEELAEWRREAPQAEIVAAGQARHATDALAQASARAGAGDDVILLVDSLTRLAEAYGDAEQAKEFFDAGRLQAGTGGGSLTVVAALERPAS